MISKEGGSIEVVLLMGGEGRAEGGRGEVPRRFEASAPARATTRLRLPPSFPTALMSEAGLQLLIIAGSSPPHVGSLWSHARVGRP